MTTLKGPFDNVPPEDKRRLQVSVPNVVADDLLLRMFPEHGFQDKLLAIFIDWFHKKCIESGIPPEFDKSNEEAAKKLLNYYLR